MKKNDLRSGFLTVEATILLPFVMIILALFIYSAIYVYDRTLLVQDTVYVVEKLREYYLMNEEDSPDIHSWVRRIKEERPYMAASNLHMSYSKKGNKITVKASVDFDCPFDYYEDLCGLSSTISVDKSENIKKAHSVMRQAYIFTRKKDE